MTIVEPLPAPAGTELPLAERSPAAECAAVAPASLRPELAHAHGKRCYWDFRECRWVCTA
jgi:hypothetical protein